jgi:hypothetical protein
MPPGLKGSCKMAKGHSKKYSNAEFKMPSLGADMWKTAHWSNGKKARRHETRRYNRRSGKRTYRIEIFDEGIIDKFLIQKEQKFL